MKIPSNDVLMTALSGIQDGKFRAVDASQRVSRFGTEGGENLVGAMVDLKLAEKQVKANVAVAKTARDLDDSILSIIA